MRNGNKRFGCIKKVTDSIRYFSWYKGVVDGCINGLVDTKDVGTKVSKIAVVHRDEFGEKFLIVWLKRYFLYEKNWNLTRRAVLPFVELEQRLFIGNFNGKRFGIFRLFLPLLEFFPDTGKLAINGGQRKNGTRQPSPYFKAEKIGDLHQTDLVGPRYLRGSNKVTRFYTFHTVDVAGHTTWASPFTDKQSISLCRHLLETGKNMGIPEISQMDNEMSATGGCRYPYSISQVVRLHLLLGIHVVFIPLGEPGRTATVESFNDLWQERVLRRHTCPTLARLRRVNERFLQYYQYEKPHRKLIQKEHGTRFPGVLRDNAWKFLNHLPKRFTLELYRDAQGRLSLPIAKGKISFVRKVDFHGKVEINGVPYFIRRKLEGQYVVTAILTQRKKMVVKHENKIIKTFSFPIKGHIIDSIVVRKKKRT
ncbi:MAG: integrase core domain-containing protein [Candidatus Brocadiaceae bacterium]|nr:integrase core domain-containing protein [Candidatus Brocadiaceae bacterium]